MNLNVLVSIIVPVYNVEKYLRECLDSIIGQTYKNLEIILVDDGSTDSSGIICDEYLKKDKRIKVIHKPNGGVAEARNSGLKCMTGEYVFFSDSDDVLTLDAIDTLVGYAYEYSADMVCAEIQSINEVGKVIAQSGDHNIYILKKKDAMRFYTQKEWGPWNRLIRSDIHKDIYYPKYKIHEDEAIKFLILEKCSLVVKVPDITYKYRRRQGSATYTRDVKMDMFYSRLNNLSWLGANYPDLADLFLPKVCEDALYNLDAMCENIDFVDKQSHINEITEFFKKYRITILMNRYCSNAYKLRNIMINLSNWTKQNNLYVQFYRGIGKL